VIFLLLDDETLSQTLHNVNQVKDRGSTVIVITNVADIESKIDPKMMDYFI